MEGITQGPKEFGWQDCRRRGETGTWTEGEAVALPVAVAPCWAWINSFDQVHISKSEHLFDFLKQWLTHIYPINHYQSKNLPSCWSDSLFLLMKSQSMLPFGCFILVAPSIPILACKRMQNMVKLCKTYLSLLVELCLFTRWKKNNFIASYPNWLVAYWFQHFPRAFWNSFCQITKFASTSCSLVKSLYIFGEFLHVSYVSCLHNKSPPSLCQLNQVEPQLQLAKLTEFAITNSR